MPGPAPTTPPAGQPGQTGRDAYGPLRGTPDFETLHPAVQAWLDRLRGLPTQATGQAPPAPPVQAPPAPTPQQPTTQQPVGSIDLNLPTPTAPAAPPAPDPLVEEARKTQEAIDRVRWEQAADAARYASPPPPPSAPPASPPPPPAPTSFTPPPPTPMRDQGGVAGHSPYPTGLDLPEGAAPPPPGIADWLANIPAEALAYWAPGRGVNYAAGGRETVFAGPDGLTFNVHTGNWLRNGTWVPDPPGVTDDQMRAWLVGRKQFLERVRQYERTRDNWGDLFPGGEPPTPGWMPRQGSGTGVGITPPPVPPMTDYGGVAGHSPPGSPPPPPPTDYDDMRRKVQEQQMKDTLLLTPGIGRVLEIMGKTPETATLADLEWAARRTPGWGTTTFRR